MAPSRILLVAVAVLSGCLGSSGQPASTAPPETWPALDLQVSDCVEGGSYVTWNAYDGDRNFPFDFEPADVSDDVGRPPLNSVGHPQEGSVVPAALVTGAYHPLVMCESWTAGDAMGTGLLLAFVGVRIEPPAFDLAPVQRQYLAGFLATDEPAVAAAFEAAGYPVEALTDSALAFDGDLLRTTIHFSHHGDIYAVIPGKAAGAKPDETIRLWMFQTNETSAAVRRLDLVDEGGQRLVASAPGYFEHLAGSTQPPVPGAPLHSYTSWMLAYTGFTRTFEAGPVVVLDGDVPHGH